MKEVPKKQECSVVVHNHLNEIEEKSHHANKARDNFSIPKSKTPITSTTFTVAFAFIRPNSFLSNHQHNQPPNFTRKIKKRGGAEVFFPSN